MENFLVLEFGSKSLKIHRRGSSGEFHKVNFPWSLGHEVYREGSISNATRKRVREVIERLISRGFRKKGMIAITTGAVRDAPDREEFLSFLREEVKIAVRILSGREEASLLAQGFLEESQERPALIIDIGGGSLEMVYLASDRSVMRDSLPLGAIRLHYLGLEGEGNWNSTLVAETVENILGEASVIQAPRIFGTGGPVKAISFTLGDTTITRKGVRDLEERVMREGPPANLSPRRRPIFLPGVMVVGRLLEHCRAEELRYQRIPIGRMFLKRFLGQTRDHLSDTKNVDLLQKMRITDLYRPRKSDQRENSKL